VQSISPTLHISSPKAKNRYQFCLNARKLIQEKHLRLFIPTGS